MLFVVYLVIEESTINNVLVMHVNSHFDDSIEIADFDGRNQLGIRSNDLCELLICGIYNALFDLVNLSIQVQRAHDEIE